jgi:hypothetical protein
LNSEGNLLKLEHQAFVEYEFLQSKWYRTWGGTPVMQ